MPEGQMVLQPTGRDVISSHWQRCDVTRRDATRRDAAKQPEVVHFRRFTVKQQLETRGDVILF